jgi:hypothetical protein
LIMVAGSLYLSSTLSLISSDSLLSWVHWTRFSQFLGIIIGALVCLLQGQQGVQAVGGEE